MAESIILGGSLVIFWPELPQRWSDLFKIFTGDVRQYNASEMQLFFSIQKWSKFGQESCFLDHFDRFFVYDLLRSLRYAPRFLQMKDLIKIYICGKFHQYNIYDCEFKNFKNFPYWFSIHKMAPFSFFFGPYSLKYCVKSCWNFDQR